MNGHQISRRTALTGTAVAGGAALATMVFGQQRHARRVFALIGDRYHNPDYIRVALTKMFAGQNLTVDYTADYEKLSASLLNDYQLFVCLRDGMIWPNGYLGPDAYVDYSAGLENSKDVPQPKPENWLREDQAIAVKDFVQAGNGFYSLHNNSHLSLSSKTMRDVQGGAYIGHPPLRPFRVRVANRTHPITQGMNDFMVNDEQHYVEYDKDKKNILLEAENLDGLTFGNLGTKSIGGWAHDYGKGRVVFTAPGHTIHVLWVPEYLALQRRSVRWLLKDL